MATDQEHRGDEGEVEYDEAYDDDSAFDEDDGYDDDDTYDEDHDGYDDDDEYDDDEHDDDDWDQAELDDVLSDEFWDEPFAKEDAEALDVSLPDAPTRPGRVLSLRRIVDVGIIAGAVVGIVLTIGWRNDGLEGFGLVATYYSDVAGKTVLADSREPRADYHTLRSGHAPRAKLIRLRGTIVAPRTGRYRFATDSRGASSLSIDGKVVVKNRGAPPAARSDRLAPRRLVGPPRATGALTLTAGAHAITVTYQPPRGRRDGSGEPFLRALWTPARRWGGLEAIPVIALLPSKPKDAKISASRERAGDDAVAGIAFLALIALAVLGLLRRAVLELLFDLLEHPSARLDLALVLLVFVLALVLRMWDLSGAGQTWDEDVLWSAARSFAVNVLDGDLRAEVWAAELSQPAGGKWVYAFFTLLSGDLEPLRVVSAVLSALTAALLVLVGRDMFGRWVGLVAGALCVAMPHVVAHGKIAGLESPSALFYMLAVWTFFRAVRRGGNNWLYIAAAIFVGFAGSVRLSNLSVLVVLLALYVVSQRHTIVEERRLPLPLNLGLLPLLVIAVIVGTWPFLWDDTAAHVARSLSRWAQTSTAEYFLGERQVAPPYYLPTYFAVTMPAAAVVACGLGMLRAAAQRTFAKLALLLWMLGPFLAALAPVVRDGVRSIYPALIPACLLAAAGLDWVARGLARLAAAPERRGAASPYRAPLSALLGALMLVYLTYCGISVHPYYLDYYNEAVGGPERVARERLFEIGWWGEGLGEAAAYVNRTAPRGATVRVMADPSHVVQLRADLRRTNAPDAHFVIYNNLLRPPFRSKRHRAAFVVRVAGAPLCWVYARR